MITEYDSDTIHHPSIHFLALIQGQVTNAEISDLRRLDPLSAVVEQRMRRKLYSVLENNKDPLHSILVGQRLQD